MERKLYKLQGRNFDLEYIDCILTVEEDQTISIIYNGNDIDFDFDSKSERDTEYKKMIDAFVKSGMTLLYDNDRDIINYSNVIMFEDPIFNSVYMQFSFEFKDGSRYESVINYSDVGESKESSREKMQKVYDELFEIWKKNEPKLHKPFHKIDLSE